MFSCDCLQRGLLPKIIKIQILKEFIRFDASTKLSAQAYIQYTEGQKKSSFLSRFLSPLLLTRTELRLLSCSRGSVRPYVLQLAYDINASSLYLFRSWRQEQQVLPKCWSQRTRLHTVVYAVLIVHEVRQPFQPMLLDRECVSVQRGF